ncbi:hypothetical protein NIES4102_09800 [Chondrocystis sp. NIES-4102]|nr:hypothetical protein NIES4102_09800 [Chondrocystis sp. NIES-4102]
MKVSQLIFVSATITTSLILSACNSGNQALAPNLNSKSATNDQEVVILPPAKPDPLAKFDLKKADALTNSAKILAGINTDNNNNFSKLENTPVWQEHHQSLTKAWDKLETQQISQVKNWSNTELATINSTKPTIFYPFSGPDFLYSNSLFPQAKEMVLVGLEPVGTVPNLLDLDSSQFNSKLQQVRNSLYAILQFSFFRTNDMKVDLQQQGVLPILYVFMARTNHRILDVDYVGLNAAAKIQPMADGLIPGVKIAYLGEGEKEPRTLYYFSTDLSNDGLVKHPQLAKFVEQLDNPITYLKAASYLMYNDSFSQIKNVILAQSSYLLQDDSGMPVNSFDTQKWDLDFYGNYVSPIALFSNRYQSDLKQIYTTNKQQIKPLNFGIGYQFEVNTSNLMLAKAKKDSVSQSQ